MKVKYINEQLYIIIRHTIQTTYYYDLLTINNYLIFQYKWVPIKLCEIIKIMNVDNIVGTCELIK